MSIDEIKKWLENVKAGDTVVVMNGGGWSSCKTYTEKVSRTTKTLIFVGGSSYSRDTGRRTRVGRWDSAYITMPTEDNLREVKRLELVQKFRSYLWDEVLLEKLEEVDKILSKE